VLVLNERHQVHVVRALDDEDGLAGVPVGVRVFQDVEQVATFDVEDDVLEPEPPSPPLIACQLGQRIFVVQREGYVYLVPFVEDEHKVFLKTIIPSRKATKQYLGEESDDHET
jgi:hypothetical protein